MNKNELEYKGYTGSVEWSEEDQLFYGKVKNIYGHFFYHGANIDELRKDFYDAVDFYLEDCEENGVEPEIPFKGSFNVRVGPDLHRKAANKAEQEGISLNKLICNALNTYLM